MVRVAWVGRVVNPRKYSVGMNFRNQFSVAGCHTGSRVSPWRGRGICIARFACGCAQAFGRAKWACLVSYPGLRSPAMRGRFDRGYDCAALGECGHEHWEPGTGWGHQPHVCQRQANVGHRPSRQGRQGRYIKAQRFNAANAILKMRVPEPAAAGEGTAHG